MASASTATAELRARTFSESMKGIGTEIENMAKDSSYFQMDQPMKVHSKMISWMALAFSNGNIMDTDMRETGKKDVWREAESSFMLLIAKLKVNFTEMNLMLEC